MPYMVRVSDVSKLNRMSNLTFDRICKTTFEETCLPGGVQKQVLNAIPNPKSKQQFINSEVWYMYIFVSLFCQIANPSPCVLHFSLSVWQALVDVRSPFPSS